MEAAGRKIVDILINNYYSDKDNLRSRTEDHVDAKCALSTLFYGRRRSTRPSSGYFERISFLFFFYIECGELLTKVSVKEEARCLSGWKGNMGEERGESEGNCGTKELCRTTKEKRRRWMTTKRGSQLVRYSNGEPLVSYIKTREGRETGPYVRDGGRGKDRGGWM